MLECRAEEAEAVANMVEFVQLLFGGQEVVMVSEAEANFMTTMKTSAKKKFRTGRITSASSPRHTDQSIRTAVPIYPSKGRID